MTAEEINKVEEASLIARAQAGDERAFTALVNRYQDLVFSFSFKVCRDQEMAKETLQDTFINIYRKLKQFDGRSKFTTWIYSIVTNNCLMKRRRRKLDDVVISLEHLKDLRHEGEAQKGGPHAQTIPSWKDSPLDVAMNKELQDLLDKAIQRLPMDHRIVFVLRDVEGESAAETAKILKLSVPALKSRLRRARVFLREQLNEYMTS